MVTRVHQIIGVLLGGILAFTPKNIIPAALASTGDYSAGGQFTAQIIEGPRLPLGRGSHAAGFIGGHVVVVGGTCWNKEGTQKSFLSSSMIFIGGSWRSGSSLDVGLAEGAFADDGQFLYLAGGITQPNQPTSSAFRVALNIAGQSEVASMPALPAAISACSAAILGSRLYVACGTFASGKSTNDLWSLDLKRSEAKWRKQAALPAVGRGYPALVACGSAIYLLGGLGDGNQSVHDRTLSDAYQYDPSIDRWKTLGNLAMPGYCWNAEPVDGSHLILAGRADGSIHDEVWLVRLPDLQCQLLGHAVIHATCAPLVKVGPSTWWLIGGEPDSNKHRTDRVSVISLP